MIDKHGPPDATSACFQLPIAPGNAAVTDVPDPITLSVLAPLSLGRGNA
jgi:hypothetical protein